jgi:DNA-binding beta-propeller fold protein YncE
LSARLATARSWLLVLGASACADAGSVTLVLDLPDDDALRPAGADTVTLVAREGTDPLSITTVPVRDGALDLGELPLSDELWLSAELRGPQQQLVGFGRAPAPLEVTLETTGEVRLPIRRPMVYLAGAGAGLVTLDASVPASGAYQGLVPGAAAQAMVADVAGTTLASVSLAGALSYVDSGTHELSSLPGATLGAAPRDVAATPDGRYVVVALANNRAAVVEVETGEVAVAGLDGAADRVAVVRDAGGSWLGVVLVDRASTDADCAPSRLAVFPLGAPETPTVVDAGAAISDLAGVQAEGKVALAARCDGAVLRFDPATGVVDADVPMFELPSPTVVAAAEDRVWAIGHDRRTNPDTQLVPDGVEDAWLVVGSAEWSGQFAAVTALPPLVTRVEATEVAQYPDQEVTQDLHANTAEATGLAVLPGAEQVAVTFTSVFHGDEFSNGFGDVVLPTIDVVTHEYWLLDGSGLAPVQRVRTSCAVTVGPCNEFACYFDAWNCLPDVDAADVGTFVPGALTTLFGGG